jgi:hypothetical protein
MDRMTRRLRPLFLVLLAASLGGCGGGSYDYYYDGWYYPWYYSNYGTWTVVGRPLAVVDGWTQRSFEGREYRGYAIERHNSPSITYLAREGDRTIEVKLTPRNDSTHVEVRTRNGEEAWDREQSKVLMGRILKEYKARPAK